MAQRLIPTLHGAFQFRGVRVFQAVWVALLDAKPALRGANARDWNSVALYVPNRRIDLACCGPK